MTLNEFIEVCGDENDNHRQTMKSLFEKAWKSWIDDYYDEESKEPRVIEIKRLGLTAEDGFFIWSYTGSSSSWLNCDRRNGQEHSSECKRLFADCLEKSLGKLPAYTGTVWRWEEADENLKKFNWFKERIGRTIAIPYFLSTAKDNRSADPMLWKIEAIENGNSRDISLISNNQFENEVLFIHGSKFEITGVGKDDKTIYMKELSPDTLADEDLCGVYYFDFNDIPEDMREPGMFD
jgi:hypothetical protein